MSEAKSFGLSGDIEEVIELRKASGLLLNLMGRVPIRDGDAERFETGDEFEITVRAVVRGRQSLDGTLTVIASATDSVSVTDPKGNKA